ncbi:PIN domain-containing protein [Geoglobus acetivorans]|uniref:PIN domain-containing protein n=1 Tax=Geoglobus acetivorans TaxID=565033 RepID=UPI00064F37D5
MDVMDVIYLDSGVLVELLLGKDVKRQKIKSIIAGKKRSTSVISFGEVLYVTVALSTERYYGNRGRNNVKRFIKERHDEYLSLYNSVYRLHSLLNLDILPHPKFEGLRKLIERYILLPRDLIHMASAIENNCNYFLTLDSDFKQIDENIDIIVIED